MSEHLTDLVNRNAAALKSTIDKLNARMDVLEEENMRLRNNVQTCINLVQQLQQTNALAIARVRGTGSTSGD